MQKDSLITPKQASEIIGVKPTALYYHIFSSGQLPLLRFPNGKLATSLDAVTNFANVFNSKSTAWQKDRELTGVVTYCAGNRLQVLDDNGITWRCRTSVGHWGIPVNEMYEGLRIRVFPYFSGTKRSTGILLDAPKPY